MITHFLVIHKAVEDLKSTGHPLEVEVVQKRRKSGIIYLTTMTLMCWLVWDWMIHRKVRRKLSRKLTMKTEERHAYLFYLHDFFNELFFAKLQQELSLPHCTDISLTINYIRGTCWNITIPVFRYFVAVQLIPKFNDVVTFRALEFWTTSLAKVAPLNI